MSELYELRLAQLERDGFLDEDAWGPEVKSGKRTGDGGTPPPANGGANTAGGKGQSARFAAGKGKGKGKKKPAPPWVRNTSQPGKTARGVPPGSSEDGRVGGRGGNAKKDDRPNRGASGASRQRSGGWGHEAGMEAHESYRHPWRGSRDNGISRRLRGVGPTDHHVDTTRARGNGVMDVDGGEARLNAQRGDAYVGNYRKPGTGGAAGNPYTRGRSGNGYTGGNSSGGGALPRPGNLKKRKRGSSSGGHRGPNPYESGTSGTGWQRTPRPPNVRKSVYDYEADEIRDSIEVVTKALNGILADYETD